jgi:Family of unknown function (DUF6152)
MALFGPEHFYLLSEDDFMKSRLIALVTIGILTIGVAAYGHHSFAGSYIEDRLVRIEGKVVEFNIRNPHSFINIEVKDKDGKMVRWGGEWGGVTQLSQGGVDRFTLQVGDFLIIDGAPSRDAAEKKVLVRRASRPATEKRPAWEWQGNVQ